MPRGAREKNAACALASAIVDARPCRAVYVLVEQVSSSTSLANALHRSVLRVRPPCGIAYLGHPVSLHRDHKELFTAPLSCACSLTSAFAPPPLMPGMARPAVASTNVYMVGRKPLRDAAGYAAEPDKIKGRGKVFPLSPGSNCARTIHCVLFCRASRTHPTLGTGRPDDEKHPGAAQRLRNVDPEIPGHQG